MLSWISGVKWFTPLPGGVPPPASLVFMVPAMIVAFVLSAFGRALGPAEGIAEAIAFLGIVMGLLIYIPAILIDSFRSKRRVEFAPWFAQLPLPAKILLAVLAAAVSVVIGVARLHVFR